MRYLRSRRGLAGLSFVAAFAAVTLFVVLPALASSPGSSVPPASIPGGITPIDVGIGGNATCSNVFPKVNGLPNLKTYLNVSPTTGTSSAVGTSFGLTMSNPSGGQRLAITSSPAVAIAAVALNGGTDNAAYDYTGLDFLPGVSTGWVSGDGNLHAPAKNQNQTYTISHLTICYRLLATISGKVFNDADGSGSATQTGIGPGTSEIRIFDNTTKKLSDVNTLADGTFSSPQPIGDSYTVCAKLPSGYANQSAPSGTSCGSATGYAPAGYTFTLATGGSSTSNFGFQSLRTISGTIYSDNNLDGKFQNNNLAPADTLLNGSWTVQLFDTTVGSATPVGSGASASGAYSFQAPIVPGHAYKLCEIPPSNPSAGAPWVQTEPVANASVTCTSSLNGVQALNWGASFTGSGDQSQNFGNVVGSACSNTNTFGGGNVLALMPGTPNGCLKSNAFAFASGHDSNTDKQYVSVAVGDPTKQDTFAPIVEQITFQDDLQANGTPTYTGLEYTAGSVTTQTPMQSCTVQASQLMDSTNTVDYGAAADPDFRLNHTYAVLRTENGPPVLPGTQTACLISLTISGQAGETGTLTALVYSTADSIFTTR